MVKLIIVPLVAVELGEPVAKKLPAKIPILRQSLGLFALPLFIVCDDVTVLNLVSISDLL
ncbi:Uncharacterised protein [Chlamydia trachomatis]|nr:Uncharacterised protein [Chlamydia trachomatis]